MELEQHLSRLQATVENGFRAVDVRMDTMEEKQTTRHTQNSTRLDGLTGQVATTNGLVGEAHRKIARTDGIMETIGNEIEKLRKFAHEVTNFMQRAHPSAKSVPELTELANRPLTFSVARAIIIALLAALIAGATFTVWVLKLSGKLN